MGRIQDGSRRLLIYERFCPKTPWEDQAVHNRSHHLCPPPPLFLRDFLCYVFLCYLASKEAGRQKPRSTTRTTLVKSLLEACPQGLGGDPASALGEHSTKSVSLQPGCSCSPGSLLQQELLPRLVPPCQRCGKGEHQGTQTPAEHGK